MFYGTFITELKWKITSFYPAKTGSKLPQVKKKKRFGWVLVRKFFFVCMLLNFSFRTANTQQPHTHTHSKMPEAEVVYSDVKLARGKKRANGETYLVILLHVEDS